MGQIVKIFKFCKHLWPYFAAVSFISVIAALMNQAEPLIVRQIIRELTSNDPSARLVIVFVLLIFASEMLSTLLRALGGYLGDIMSTKMSRHLSYSYFEHMLKLPQSYFDRELTGTITARLNRSSVELTNFINMFSNNFMQFIFSTVFSLIIVFALSWQVGLLMAVVYRFLVT